MILDKLENAQNYYGMGCGMRKAFEFLISNDIRSLKDGRYDIDGEKIYALLQTVSTRRSDLLDFENHGRFVDIQMTLSGEEVMEWAPLEELVKVRAYDVGDDCALWRGAGQPVRATNGVFAVFLPTDAHKPCVAPGEPGEVRKVVVKISVEEVME
jgi:YhcH/YjgK/YiaL family protein